MRSFYDKVVWTLKTRSRRLYHRYKALRLQNHRPSIIANNCIGTFMYYDMGLPYCSPTINLTLSHDDFIRFVQHLPEYLASDVYEETDIKVSYPVGTIRYGEEALRLNFMHYASFEEAREKWNMRKQRVDFNNIYIVEFKETASEQAIEEFAKLPYAHKMFVTNANPNNCDCVEVMEFLNDEGYHTGQLLKYKPRSLKRYLDDLDYISFLNEKENL